MFAVQIGHYAWLGADGLVTTSMRHAARLQSFPAEERAQYLRDHRRPALVHLSRKQRDFYISAPVTVITAEELDARISALSNRDDREVKPAIPTIVAAPADRDATPRKEGITRQIYQWTLSHPEATKADAQAAFPSANPSTVSVQFSAARRSQVS